MVESGRSYFIESELEDMRVLIRLTVEFFHYLQGEDLSPGVEDKVRYVCDSVFSGIDSFGLVHFAYRFMAGARITTLAPGGKSIDSLKEEFISRYREFSQGQGQDFEFQCRLLLDLFKLQIVFAGLSY